MVNYKASNTGGPNVPAKLDVTLKGMPEIGTSPILVFAVTLVVPLKSKLSEAVRVTSANMASNASSFKAVKGTLLQEIGRSAIFPVETPPTVSDVGRLSY